MTGTPAVEKLVTATRPGRALAGQFVAGDTLDQAVDVARTLNAQGFLVSLDLLGEEVYDRNSALAATDEYLECLDRIGSDQPLDHNFPEPILNNLRDFITEVNLIPLRRIDDRLPELDDRRLLIAIHQLGFPGIVTSNYKMLQNPRELAAVIAPEICVFAIEGVGHDPIRATGALLLDLPSAVRGMEAGRRGVFWLRPRSPQPQDPNELFNRASQRRDESPKELFDQVRVTAEELSTPLL